MAPPAPEETTHFGIVVAIIFPPFKGDFQVSPLKLRWRQLLRFVAEFFFSSSSISAESIRGSEKSYFGRHRIKLLQPGVIVGYGDAQCCYRQTGR